MKEVLKEKNKYILRFDSGDEVIGVLKNFCKKENIKSGFFSAFGACGELTLAYYSLDEKKYEEKDVKERLEIVSLTGNIAKMDDEIIVHAHGLFSDLNMQVRGGHIKKLVVSATCEMFLTVFDDYIKRGYDESTGLNLIK